MHPLVARIHPSFRVAFVAWLVSRSALMIAFMLAGTPLFEPVRSELGLMLPLWWGVDLLNTQVTSISAAGTWSLIAVGEFVLAISAVAVFRFVRRDALPHVAERATWLWCASPLMFLLPPGNPWILAIGAGVISLELVASGKTGAAAFLLGVGMLIRPELALLVPGLFALSWKTKTSDLAPWLMIGVPVAAFSLLVFGTILWADSPRALYEAGQWRQNWMPNAWLGSLPDLAILAACTMGMVLSVLQLKRTPRSWLMLGLPLVVWPILQEPSITSSIPLLLGAPLFGHLGFVSENPSLERPLLVSSIVALILLPFVA